MREMRDSGVEWIGEIPKDWNCCKQKYRFTLINGRAFKDNEFEEDGTYRILRVGNLFSNPVWYSSSLELEPDKYCEKGDLIYAWSMSYGPYIWNEEKVIYHYHIWKTKLVSDMDKMFSYYYLQALTESIKSQTHETTMGFVTMGIMNNSYIAYPRNIKEQKKISDYLDAKCSKIDEIIEKQLSIIEKLKEYKLSIITEIVTKGLKHNVKMKDSGVRFVDTIPYDWENRKMITILSTRVVDGPHESPELYDRGIPYISATAIVNGKIDFSLMRGYISKEYCEICDKRYSPQRGDLLVVKLGASTGQVAIVDTDERFNIWVPLAAVRCNDEALPKFVYYAFQSDYFVRQMELSWTFGTQQTLGVQTIEKLRILLPPIAEQRKIVKFLDTIYDYVGSKIEKVEKMIEKLEEYKKSLIYEVVTGKKEV